MPVPVAPPSVRITAPRRYHRIPGLIPRAPKPVINIGFKGKNTAAQRVAARQAAALVTGVSRQTRDAIRAIIVRSIRQGIPPYDAARMIRQLVGMNERQAQAAANYRDSMINSGLPLAKVEAAYDRYVEKKIRERAILIARTETIAALNFGEQESWKEAQADGLLSDSARKSWMTTPDEKLCARCDALDGVAVPLDGEFQSDGEGVSGPPLHPACRCALACEP